MNNPWAWSPGPLGADGAETLNTDECKCPACLEKAAEDSKGEDK